MTQCKFYYDFGSPNSYLSHLIIPKIEKRNKISFDYIPILLGGIFKLTGNVSPFESLRGVKNKAEYLETETNRFLKKHRLTNYTFNPDFPLNTLNLMRGAVFAKSKPYYKEYVDAIFKSMWAIPKKVDEEEIFKTVLTEARLPMDDILQGVRDKNIKDVLIENTNAAVSNGVFGSPTFFVDNEMFFGKDRLWEVETEIKKRAT